MEPKCGAAEAEEALMAQRSARKPIMTGRTTSQSFTPISMHYEGGDADRALVTSTWQRDC